VTERLYAAGTAVTADSSMREIRATLHRYGASGFLVGQEDGRSAVVGFRAHGRNVRFTMPLPTLADVAKTAAGQVRSASAQKSALAAEERRRWRAVALAIKAKLEVVATGIATFEEEFAMWTVLPDGLTVADHVLPAVAHAVTSGAMPHRLLALPEGKP